MEEFEALLALLAATTALVALARRVGIPYPILLVLGGLGLSLIPDLPEIHLDPELIFVLVLPPILQSAAFFTPVRDFRAQIRPILSLAVGLVLLTTCAVAVVAHWVIDGLSWPSAFVLGAVVSPPDAVAATSVAERLRLPRRVTAILEGESLVNDATALVTYRVAVAAAVTGSFSFGEALWDFVVAVGAGVLVGVVVGKIVYHLMLPVEDASILIAISLLAPYAQYLLAEQLHGSGILAVVIGGFIMSRGYFRLRNPEARIQSIAFWDMFIFLLNGFVFILIGLQLPDVLDGIADVPASTLLLYAAAVSLTAILVRITWVFFTSDPRLALSGQPLGCSHGIDRRELAVISWAGMRGVVSLAAALALSQDVPGRDLIIFLTFAVILVTLVGQGLTLGPLIRKLGVAGDEKEEREELAARGAIVRAGRARLDELAAEEWVIAEVLEDLLLHADQRTRQIDALLDGQSIEHSDVVYVDVFKRVNQELYAAQLAEATRLRDSGLINDETLRRIQRDIDVDLIRLQRY